jgi:hypothetical protein
MEIVLKVFHGAECAGEDAAEVSRSGLLSEIKDVSRLLAYNDCWFQSERDSSLIEACIYQRRELEARYRYLMGLAKRNGVSCAAF